MNLNQSFNWHQTRRKQNLVSAKSASLELVPETTSDLENYTTETPGRHQEELNWYRTLYEQTPSIFFALDVTGVILSVNKFGANCLGYEPCDLIQKLFFNIFAVFERKRLSDTFAKLLSNSSEEVENWDFCLNCPDSKIKWVKLKARISFDEAQNPTILVVCEDITAYKQTHSSKQSEQSFREFANSAPVMLWTTDETGLHNFFNCSWLKLTGHKLEQELGWGWLNNLYHEDKNLYLETYCQALKEKDKFQI
ncbi:MAG: PAS domain S-box protein, partial [Rivularia sp. ALOHA_DT_140]|nr:PAS domain S-box protein [Rivularia sp. ALOHA_DT_140]